MKKLLLTLAFAAAATFAFAADDKKADKPCDKADKACAENCDKPCCKDKKACDKADKSCCEKPAADQKAPEAKK